MSEHTLFELLRAIEANGIRLPASKRKTISWLQEVGLLTPIAVQDRSTESERRTKFYSLDLAADAEPKPDPVDLLQAYHSEGIICYFSAVAFHSLTTQPVAHHHIAIARETPRRSRSPAPRRAVRQPRRIADPLGTRLFSYLGTKYYKTLRDERLMPGVQLRYHNPHALIQITTLEQTLLDTLHRPQSCGGPPVIIEAWEQALQRVNDSRLADYLRKMDHLPTAQRVGYMLDSFDYQPTAILDSVLNEFLCRLNAEDSSVYQQLFAGTEYHDLKFPWLVFGPI